MHFHRRRGTVLFTDLIMGLMAREAPVTQDGRAFMAGAFRGLLRGSAYRRSVGTASLRLGITDAFKSPTSHENLDRAVLRPRLLLCLHGLATPTPI